MTLNELETFARTFFVAVDAQNAEGLRSFLSSDVILQMANMEPTRGIEALIDAFKATEERFSSLEHEVQGIWTGEWVKGSVVSVEAVAHYVLENGKKVSLPVTSTLRLDQSNLITDYRIFIDPAPAFID